LEQVSSYLKDQKWFAGENLTYADFAVYDLFYTLKLFNAKSIKAFNNLAAFVDRFEALPQIKAYNESDRALLWPCTARMCMWGGEDMPFPGKK